MKRLSLKINENTVVTLDKTFFYCYKSQKLIYLPVASSIVNFVWYLNQKLPCKYESNNLCYSIGFYG